MQAVCFALVDEEAPLRWRLNSDLIEMMVLCAQLTSGEIVDIVQIDITDTFLLIPTYIFIIFEQCI